MRKQQASGRPMPRREQPKGAPEGTTANAFAVKSRRWKQYHRPVQTLPNQEIPRSPVAGPVAAALETEGKPRPKKQQAAPVIPLPAEATTGARVPEAAPAAHAAGPDDLNHFNRPRKAGLLVSLC